LHSEISNPAKRCACRAVALAEAVFFTEPKTSALQSSGAVEFQRFLAKL
jgi:hypothetical protein